MPTDSRPAAVPGWTEIDYFDGAHWLNESPLRPDSFADYKQTLDLYAGELRTEYRWLDAGRATRIAVETLASQADPHLGLVRLTLTPEFDGRIKVRFALRPRAPFANRLPLARLDLLQLKRAIAERYNTPPIGDTALLSQALKPATATAPNRAAIWYPGEVDIDARGAEAGTRTLHLAGRARNGAGFRMAAAIGLPPQWKHAHVGSENSADGVALEIEGEVKKGVAYRFNKLVAIARDGWDADVARTAVQARDGDVGAMIARHRTAWAELWKSDILVEGDADMQRTIHADLYYLLQNSTVDTAWGMAACGFSPNYFGHVFWDNDNWDFPALLLLHPQRAKSSVMFRNRTLPAALARAQAWGFRGAMYPWESDPERGDEGTPHFAGENSEQEIHLNGDIAATQWQYFLATGDIAWLAQYGWPVIRATAEFWASRVTFDRARDRYEILHVTSPDEAYTDVDNDAFTNAVAQQNLINATAAAKLVVGATPDPVWATIARKMYLPFSDNEQRYLDFDANKPHDKQTWMGSALPFLAYPALDYTMTPKVRRNVFDYAERSLKELTPDANAMLLSILAIHAATLGDEAASIKWLRRNQEGFFKPPFNVRSETARNNTTYILATVSGFLQNFLYGYSGLRITDAGLAEKYPPLLPRGWKSLTLKNIAFRGERFDYVVSRDASGKVVARRSASH